MGDKMKIISFIISIIIPNLFGFIGNLLGNSQMGFKLLTKPPLTPPGIVFPIVWIILYTLMGISLYIIYSSNDKNKKNAIIIFFIQLILNTLWTLFFFNLKMYLFSFFWILLIIIFVIIMIKKFLQINPLAGYLQIPYLIWLIFAAYLNLGIYILN